MSRVPMLIGNWKMNKTLQEARDFAQRLGQQSMHLKPGCEYAICAPYTSLHLLRVMLPAQVQLGAQNVYHEVSGAYTGEISASMLVDFGTKFVLAGHSERRAIFGESNEMIARKVSTIMKAGMTPILCVGETIAEREAGQTEHVVKEQVLSGVANLESGEVETLVIAYEPVWAIGTGKTASVDDAGQVIGWIRQILVNQFSSSVANHVRILYGGSVKADNIASFVGHPEIDGGLVGGASLEADSFVGMAKAIEGGQR